MRAEGAVRPRALTRPPLRSARVDTALVFLAVFFVLVGLTYGSPLSFDGQVMYAVARAIIHGRLHLVLGQPPFPVAPAGNFAAQFPYSHYGIGVSLVILPLYGVARVFHLSTNLMVLCTNPLITAAAAAVLYRIGLALAWPRRLAVAVALAFGLLTMMAQDSTDLFSEPGVALGIGLLLLALLRWRDGKSGSGLLAGTGIGIAILFRTDSIVLVAPALLAAIFLVDRQTFLPRLRRETVGFLVPVVPVLAWTSYYSHLSSGHWLPHTYGGRFDSPFWTGFYGQLIGPNKGFFFYDPWLLLAVPGVVLLLVRRDLVWAAVLGGLFVVRVVFYAKWNYWFGGVAWGPRFVVPAILPMCLLAGESLRVIPTLIPTAKRAVGVLTAAALLAWSGLITVASVWVSYVTDYQRAHPAIPADATAAQREALGSVGRHNHLFVASESEWWLAVRHLGDPTVLYYFRGSPSPLGIALIIAGAACVAASLRPRRPLAHATGMANLPVSGSATTTASTANTPRHLLSGRSRRILHP